MTNQFSWDMRKYASEHSLHWHHNGRDGVSNHQTHDYIFNRLFRRISKKTYKPRVTGLCVGNSPVTSEFSAQMVSNAKMFPFDDVIMLTAAMQIFCSCYHLSQPINCDASWRDLRIFVPYSVAYRGWSGHGNSGYESTKKCDILCWVLLFEAKYRQILIVCLMQNVY